MPTRNIVFVAYQDQPNLGIGYLSSVLLENNFNVEMLDFRLGSKAISDRVQELDPLIIGLSIIYQYFVLDFEKLANDLRDNEVNNLICAGGHFPSLEPATTLNLIPDLDFIVRFEGEYTLVEIAKRLYDGLDWKDVRSIAYKQDGTIITTPLRPLITDLDCLPFPKHWSFIYQCLGVQATSILASRGCPQACSFCSIRKFYSIPPGQLRRTRSPENVIQEMLHLNKKQGVRIFLFQDDDFSLMSKRDRMWTWRFLENLHQSDLDDSIIWKISCRADEVEYEIFSALKSAGLYMVYLGIESGNETGLKILNKHINTQQNLEAVEILKRLGIRYDFGFMLFDPSSTIELILENIRFLRQICGDGSATVSFGKTLPYAGTDLENQMRKEGRLHDDIRFPDYNFLDHQTESLFNYLSEVFFPWVYGNQSLQAQLRWALFEVDVMMKFHQGIPGLEKHKEMIRYLVHWYNEIFFRIVEASAEAFLSQTGNVRTVSKSIQGSAEEQRLWLENQLAFQRMEFFTNAGFPIEMVVGHTEEQSLEKILATE